MSNNINWESRSSIHISSKHKESKMVFRVKPIIFSLLVISTLTSSKPTDPTPTPWPEQFHSVMLMTTNGTTLQMLDLWYDWPNGRNLNIIQSQLGELLYDLEWTNGTSFYYTLDSNKKCKVMSFPVGILTPNWLHGATYIGQENVDGFLCNVWEKVDFITYYEDVVSKIPVSWAFYTGMTAHLMTFEVGKVLEDPYWQAPVYCFNNAEQEPEEVDKKKLVIARKFVPITDSPYHGTGRLMRPVVMKRSMAL